MGDRATRPAAIRMLKQTRGNLRRAAEKLGISYSTLYRGLRDWGLLDPSDSPDTQRIAMSVSGESSESQNAESEGISLQSIRAEARLATVLATQTDPSKAATFRIRKSLLRRARIAAAEDERVLSSIVEAALQLYLDQRGPREPRRK